MRHLFASFWEFDSERINRNDISGKSVYADVSVAIDLSQVSHFYATPEILYDTDLKEVLLAKTEYRTCVCLKNDDFVVICCKYDDFVDIMAEFHKKHLKIQTLYG